MNQTPRILADIRSYTSSVRTIPVLIGLFLLSGFASLVHANPVKYPGSEPKKNKHIVLIASDHEYRSEETIPALARILAKRHGFDCTVLFGLNKKGKIKAGSNRVPGMEALEDADGLVISSRFLSPDPDQMEHLHNYLQRGGPVVGLRSTTHGFKYDDKDDPYYKYHFKNSSDDYLKGFGRQVLGQTWVGHYGKNHKQSTRITPVPEQSDHPILQGVENVHVKAGAYNAEPNDDWTVLTKAQPLQGMQPDAKPDPNKPPIASEWTRTYESESGNTGRVFTSLYGAAPDLLNDGYRRLLINGIHWAFGEADEIEPDMNIDFVGPYNPNNYGFGDWAKGIDPAAYEGFKSPIPAHNNAGGYEKDKDEEDQSSASGEQSSDKYREPVRYVRIELKGDERILTLNEVEITKDGKNIAKGKDTSQSTVKHGGEPDQAIDGNKSPEYPDDGQTHTEREDNPWWEIDLGSETVVDQIEIWNRGKLQDRLDNFILTGLDADRNRVFRIRGYHGPDGSIRFDLENDAKAAIYNFDGEMVQKLTHVPADYEDPSKFRFQKGDTVAIIGNALADRMQHHGWTETAFQKLYPEKQLRFRHLGTTADEVDHFPRNRFPNLTQHLDTVDPDVIFAFFGYNESYDGNPDKYRKKLGKLIHRLRKRYADRQGIPRMVLFSPIAFEDLNNPNLPEGKSINERLSAYTGATREAAEENGVAFVDLFAPTREAYQNTDEPLTINGSHANEEGYRRIAEVIASSLSGDDVSLTEEDEYIRSAVQNKNWLWHNYYRPPDSNDIWGGRAVLKHMKYTNGEVLRHELTMIKAMVENRDPKIWARANGEDLKVDDSDIPDPLPVKSNVRGKGKMSSTEEEGLPTYLSPEKSKQLMDVRDGFEINVFASEKRFPRLANPVQMQVDAQGRLWAAAWASYPKWEPPHEMRDALLIFPDENGDGKADKAIEFARVHNPLGFEFWNGGVIVTSQPKLLFLKDTDGDNKADIRRVLIKGLGSSDTHHSANNLIYGPDGYIYWQAGNFLSNKMEHPWGPAFINNTTGMYRYDPRRHKLSYHAKIGPNPHGISFDYWGYHYATDATSGNPYQVRRSGSGFKMDGLFGKEVRPVAAHEIISSNHFPEKFQGNMLICNTIGFLGLKQYKLNRNPDKNRVKGKPNGGQLKTKKRMPNGDMTSTSGKGFLMSGDKNFRPTDAVFGARGALYVSDWQNQIIGHMQHNVRDPNRDKTHGRIFRITAKNRPLQEPVAIEGEPIPSLLQNLTHPVNGIRHRTRIELSERNSRKVIEATREWMKQFNPNKKEDAHHLLEALWLHQQHNFRHKELLKALLNSPSKHAQNAAKRVQHMWDIVDPVR